MDKTRMGKGIEWQAWLKRKHRFFFVSIVGTNIPVGKGNALPVGSGMVW
jgi:hypothetical protein